MVDKLNHAELYERIKLVLKEAAPKRVPHGNISPETRLMEDLNLNSLHAVNLVLALEDAFGISIEDGVIGRIKTVEELVAMVRGKID
jgi:acyl carrier protein